MLKLNRGGALETPAHRLRSLDIVPWRSLPLHLEVNPVATLR
ncbi:hypothetical protein [Bremerella sp. JC817]